MQLSEAIQHHSDGLNAQQEQWFPSALGQCNRIFLWQDCWQQSHKPPRKSACKIHLCHPCCSCTSAPLNDSHRIKPLQQFLSQLGSQNSLSYAKKPKTWPQLQAPAHTVGEGTGGAHQPSLKAPSAAQELLEPDTSLQFAPARELMSAVDWGPQQAPAGLHINIIDCRHRSMRLNYGD